MDQFLLVVHIFITVALVATVLLQRSEGGALGMGGNPMGGLMGSRAAASFMSRTTAILATAFMVSSIILAIQGSLSTKEKNKSKFDLIAPIEEPTTEKSVPFEPNVPVAK